MMDNVYVVICSDGALKFSDMKQCQDEKWLPISVFYKENDIHVIAFTDPLVGKRFIKRNYPKNWLVGVIALSEMEIDWLKEKGWKLELFSYPNLLHGRKLGYEILEFQSNPELLLK